MPRQQIIYDLLDLVTKFESKIDQSDFAVYMYSLYSHHRNFRFVRIFDGIFDKDVLKTFVETNSLMIAGSELIPAVEWEFSLWITGIKVRKSKAADYPHIAPVIHQYLDDLVSKSRVIYKATLQYISSIDLEELKVKDISEDTDSDLSSCSSKSSVSSNGTRKPRSVTLAEVKKLCIDHIPDAASREQKIKDRDEYITRRLDEETQNKLIRAEKASKKAANDLQKAQKEVEKEQKRQQKAKRDAEDAEDRERKRKQKAKREQEEAEDRERKRQQKAEREQEEAEEREQKRKQKAEDEERRRLIREAEEEKLADLLAEKEQRRLKKEQEKEAKIKAKQDKGIQCACGDYYTASNYSHHIKTNITHKQFLEVGSCK